MIPEMLFIPDFNQRYSVTPNGQVYSHITYKFLKPYLSNTGYYKVNIAKEKGGSAYPELIHRLVAKTFFGESNLEVDHVNEDKSDNSIYNLQYLTRAENVRKSNTGRVPSQKQRDIMSQHHSGKGNPNFDNAIYTLINKDGRTFSGTHLDFRETFGYNKHVLLDLKSGKAKTRKGWSLYQG